MGHDGSEQRRGVKDVLGIYLLFFGTIVWGITRGGCEAYLVTLTDICSFLCVSGQRGTIAK